MKITYKDKTIDIQEPQKVIEVCLRMNVMNMLLHVFAIIKYNH